MANAMRASTSIVSMTLTLTSEFVIPENLDIVIRLRKFTCVGDLDLETGGCCENIN